MGCGASLTKASILWPDFKQCSHNQLHFGFAKVMPGLKEYTNQKLLFPVSFVSFCEGKKILNCCPHAVFGGKIERGMYFLSRSGFAWWIRLCELLNLALFYGSLQKLNWRTDVGFFEYLISSLASSLAFDLKWNILPWRLPKSFTRGHQPARRTAPTGRKPSPEKKSWYPRGVLCKPAAHRVFDRNLSGKLPQKRPLNRGILNSPKLFV